MKNKHLLLFLVVFLTASVFSFSQVNTGNAATTGDDERAFAKLQQEARDYIYSRRANQKTGKIDPNDVIKAMDQVQTLRKNKGGNPFNLAWDEIGPNNYPGRIRCFLVDNESSELLFAGSTSGGLWKSAIGGLHWERTKTADGKLFETLSVSCITQATNGDIYFGTGNNFAPPVGDKGKYYSEFMGQGIYKSTDRGNTFSRIASTWSTEESKLAFSIVNEVAVDPNNSERVYAATLKGLRVSKDGGDTWFNPLSGDDAEENATDVQVASDGTVIASVNNQAYLSPNGDNGTFVLKSGTVEDGLILNTTGRVKFAFAPSDPNYVYALSSNVNGTFQSVYQSQDKGETWRIIGPGGSSMFRPFTTSGIFSMALAVNPDDPEYIIVAGTYIWIWSQTWAWEKLTQPTYPENDELFVHDRQHAIVFDMQHPDTVYITNNGGVTRSVDGGYTYRRINKNLNTTHFVSVAASGSGEVVGGTFDNGTLYMNFQSADSLTARKYVTEGATGQYPSGRWNGGQVDMSMMAPNLIFFSVPYGCVSQIDLADARGWPKAIKFWPSNGRADGALVTAIELYENWNDDQSWEYIRFIADRDYIAGEYITANSWTYKRPLVKKLDADLYEGDTVMLQDTYGSLFVLGRRGKGGIKMQRRGLTLNARRNNTVWSPIYRFMLEDRDVVEQLAIGHANQGDVVYASIKNETDDSPYRLYRCTNMQNARDRRSSDATTAIETIVVVTKVIAQFDQVITDIEVDPNNDENVIVTLGNYGNDYNIVMATNAYTCGEDSANFVSIQGNLPNMPVYAAQYDWESSKSVYLGTEHGMYSTRDITASAPVWTDENQNGLENVPVFDIDQQHFENDEERGIYNHGVMYIATHGRGLFKTDTRRGPSIKMGTPSINLVLNEIKISPNPVSDYANLSFELSENSDVDINIYSISGSIVKTINLPAKNAGQHMEPIDVNNFKAGTYILEMRANGNSSTTKFIIR